MTTPDGQGGGRQVPGAVELSLRAFEAVSRRDTDAVVVPVGIDVRIEIHSDIEGGTFTHQDLWQDVHIVGRDNFHRYLAQLFRVLPSLTMVTVLREASADSGRAEFTAELAGVTTEGKPFDAAGRIEVMAAGSALRTIRANITHMAVGPQLLRRPFSDPRRYFEYFLEEASNASEADAADHASIQVAEGAA